MNKCIIIISHSNYRIKTAGIEKCIYELTNIFGDNDIHNIHIFPLIELNRYTRLVRKRYIGINIDGAFCGVYDESNLYGILTEFRQRYEYDYMGVHIHQLQGWNLIGLERDLRSLGLPIKLFIHDYDMVCMGTLKRDGKGTECSKSVHEPELQKCRECKYYGNGVLNYSANVAFLRGISPLLKMIIAPSEVAAQIWGKVFSEYADIIVVRSHLIFEGWSKEQRELNCRTRIAYIGSTEFHKGFEKWNEVIDTLSTEEYDFFYFGKDSANRQNVRDIRVDFQSDNSKKMSDYLKEYNIDMAFIWPTWNETFCYVAYEACEAGCFIISNTCSGNIASLVKKYNTGLLFDSLSDCKLYLNDTEIIKESNINRRVRVAPLFSVNTSITELVFNESDYNKKRYTYCNIQGKKVKKNRMFSFVYLCRRGSY